MATARIEESLLDLFRTEAEAQSIALAESLAALAAGVGGAKEITVALESARALKGAARLVGLDLAAQLAQEIENVLAAVLEHKQPPKFPIVQALDNANVWLAQFSQFPSSEMVNPSTFALEGHAACLHELRKVRQIEQAAEKKNGRKSKERDQEDSASARAGAPTFIEPTPLPPPAAKLDFSLLDMYRDEAATQLASLAQGIVELEGDLANAKKIEPVMRAAHSLKGAARIIGLDLVVHLAHTMEDTLVAAQQGRLTLNAEGIDALLHAGDWLGQFSQLRQDQLAVPPPEQVSAQAACLADVQAILSGKLMSKEPGAGNKAKKKEETAQKPALMPAPATTGEPPAESRKAETTVPASTADGVVRVSATSLSRLMGLAAESLVETRRLEPFRDQLLKLKNSQLQFVSKLEAAAQARAANAGTAISDISPLCSDAQGTLTALREQLENFDNAARRSMLLSGRLYQEVIASRMRPFGEGTQAFPRLVRDVCRTLGKQAKLEIEGRDTPVDRDILEKLEAPLSHLLRNACDHGLEMPTARVVAGKPEMGVIRLEAHHRAGMLVVQVGEDGRGISIPALRKKIVEKGRTTAELAANMSDDEILQFLFLPGFSTAEQVTEISGRGVGLDVVQALVREVGGTVRIYTSEGRGTVFALQLPVTRSVIRALLVELNGEAYAFPLTRLHRAVRGPHSLIELVEGRPRLSVDGLEASLVCARAALGLPVIKKKADGEVAAVVVSGGLNFFALEVDRLLGETDLVVRPLDARLGKVPGISAAALGEDGAPILIVDVDDLIPRLEKIAAGEIIDPVESLPRVTRRRILVVDDSATVRETIRKILEGAGFDLETAVDGADGWNAVRVGHFDLVVSDVDMPRLDGLGFVARIRAEARLNKLPVIMVSYKDREEDRGRGLAAGADVYLAKSSLTDETFLQSVKKLLNTPCMNIGLVNDLPIALVALRRVVEKVPGYTIAWEARDGREALQRCLASPPDLVLMDLIMPVMDGAESTREIMRQAPCPILVVTASVTVNAAKVYEAMGYGALDAVRTPTLGPNGDFEGGVALLTKIERVALLSGKMKPSETRNIFPPPSTSPSTPAQKLPPMLAIGVSTGGPQALAEILSALPKPFPAAIAIVQHVDSEFAEGLAQWLASRTGHDVVTARAGVRFESGRVYLAATQDHLVADATGTIAYTPLPREIVYRPSVDVFFRSLAQNWSTPGVAVVLTGMGRDGAAGLKLLRERGWMTIAQGPLTSIVYGMPKAAADAGAAQEILELPCIGPAIAKHFRLHKLPA